MFFEQTNSSQSNSGRGSPSLDDLETKKRLLLDALGDDGEPENTAVINNNTAEGINLDSGSEIEYIANKMDTDNSDVLEINVSNITDIEVSSSDIGSPNIMQINNDEKNTSTSAINTPLNRSLLLLRHHHQPNQTWR